MKNSFKTCLIETTSLVTDGTIFSRALKIGARILAVLVAGARRTIVWIPFFLKNINKQLGFEIICFLWRYLRVRSHLYLSDSAIKHTARRRRYKFAVLGWESGK